MTSEPREAPAARPVRRLGPIGRRLLAAFVLVVLSAVAVLTAAALIGTGRGLSEAQQQDRSRVAGQAAAGAATAYSRAGGWSGADLGPAQAVAAAADARLIARDGEGHVVTGAGEGRGHGMGGTGSEATGMGAPGGTAGAPVTVDGTRVGSVTLAFRTPAGSAAERVAWSWIGAAAAVALVVAVLASWWITRRLVGPIARVAAAARAIAAGDRDARARVEAPGELGDLAQSFDTMADHLARADQARRNLAADVAHELRTPLATLQAGLEELRDGLAEPDPAALAALHDQSLRLGRIVADLAELSAAEAAGLSLRPRPVDLNELARTALADHEPALRAAGLRLTADLADVPVTVVADADRLHQAIGNLLGNAARYCRPDDSVRVSVRADRATARIEVADTGPGIPADELPYVFERLWRGRAQRGAAGPTGGSGIGLAVVREVVAAHGGTVTAESSPEGGATFTVTLPLGPR